LFSLRVDLQANPDSFGKLAVVLYRVSQWLPRPLNAVITALLRILCGFDMPASVKAGVGLRLPHGARGSVVHPRAVIGDGVTLHHGVTLGVSGAEHAAPQIGDGAYIGAGACILGGVIVGVGAKVGANSVVLMDVPAGATAVGVPASIVRSAECQIQSIVEGRGD
jgi:serine acetyltransferase